MINAIASLDSAQIILRSELIDATGLREDLVIDGLSAYGANLATYLNDIQHSIAHEESNPEEERDDALLVFEIRSNTDSTNNAIEGDILHAAYYMHVTIYGNACDALAVRAKQHLLDYDIKVMLNLRGVHVSKISNIESRNEFKNEVMWKRRDFDISFAVRF